ncbi:hypothetical protein ADT26_12780 [Xanthomonas oryzae]|nr:hypothetical protein AXO1947_09665 [Xanthomonas oryzae pv. oryzae]KOR42865.1 hypothetical protein ADT26_12780 [Xanthomonas oryzae]AUI90713.1 hypothetical protein BVV16_11835 [Xanthomonas oryzae pv. oryzae]AUI94388.1 hypothetical protein BVV17_11840 [Xanthomonas oryzae pv. oryzae]AUI98058.1 hypothetical protein BVV18_11845 [Xanthomonas oryzae pv. oryzae]
MAAQRSASRSMHLFTSDDGSRALYSLPSTACVRHGHRAPCVFTDAIVRNDGVNAAAAMAPEDIFDSENVLACDHVRLSDGAKPSRA